MRTCIAKIAAMVLVMSIVVACEGRSGGDAIIEEIPPCTPVQGSDVDPCEPDIVLAEPVGGIGSPLPLGQSPTTLREILDGEVQPYVTHLVVRGTYLPNTVRCIDGLPFRPHPYEDPEEHGAFLNESFSFRCFVDVRANAYVVGTGPSTLTVSHHAGIYWNGWFANNPLDVSEEAMIERMRAGHEATLSHGVLDQNHYADTGAVRLIGGLEGREVMLFLGPPSNLAVEGWEVMERWDIQRDADGTVRVIHPDRERWKFEPNYNAHRSALEPTISQFNQAASAAHQSRVAEYNGRTGSGSTMPTLVADVGTLPTFLAGVGANDHPDGPPAPIPPACGRSVPDTPNNPSLVTDCETLLAVKDTLRGEAALAWDLGTPIAEWDGVTVSGAPKRVTELRVSDRSLSGSVPPGIGRLTALHALYLHGNALTSSVPEELAALAELQVLTLNGNQLTGTIPASLGGLASLVDLWLHKNDLSGPIPLAFGDLANLRSILLAGNNLTGCIPRELYIVETNDMHLIDLPTCL